MKAFLCAHLWVTLLGAFALGVALVVLLLPRRAAGPRPGEIERTRWFGSW